MYQISKESIQEKGVFDWRRLTFVKWCKEEKCAENRAIFMNISCKLLSQFLSNLVSRVTDIKHVNIIEISPVVIEIEGLKTVT